jgi:hypothetical protein
VGLRRDGSLHRKQKVSLVPALVGVCFEKNSDIFLFFGSLSSSFACFAAEALVLVIVEEMGAEMSDAFIRAFLAAMEVVLHRKYLRRTGCCQYFVVVETCTNNGWPRTVVVIRVEGKGRSRRGRRVAPTRTRDHGHVGPVERRRSRKQSVPFLKRCTVQGFGPPSILQRLATSLIEINLANS